MITIKKEVNQMDAIFAVSDIHGEEMKLKRLLSHWKHDREQLVIVGDLVDRGEDSLGVILLARKLQKEYGAKIVGGNHDDMFLSWIQDPMGELDLYYPQGGMQTIDSFFNSRITLSRLPEHIAKMLKEQFPSEIEFLKSLPDYYEHGKHVFVHAGVNLAYENWKNTSHNDFRWIRHPFHYGRNDTGKIFVFGHTITRNLHPDRSNDVWVSPCKTKIGIDGGAVFNGFLHGLRITNEAEYEVFSVDTNLHSQSKKLILHEPVLSR